MADLAKIVDDLSVLTVLEAAELSKMLEEKWGVSAAAPVAVAAAGAADGMGRERSSATGSISSVPASRSSISYSIDDSRPSTCVRTSPRRE